MHQASAAPGCVDEPPSWLFHPQTGASSPQSLYTELRDSSSSVRDAAPTASKMAKDFCDISHDKYRVQWEKMPN